MSRPRTALGESACYDSFTASEGGNQNPRRLVKALRNEQLCRLVLAALGAWFGLAKTAHAVIPGLAPGLVAILPQLFLLVVATMAMLFSPRTWWRLTLTAVRHPIRTGGVGLAVALLYFGSRGVKDLLPRSEAGLEIPNSVAGFALGDPYAERRRGYGLGPISSPQSVACRWSENGRRQSAIQLTNLGERVLVLLDGRTRVACFDPLGSRAVWEVSLEEPVAAGPLGFERRLPTGERSRGVVLVTRGGREVQRVADEGNILLLDGGDGSIVGRLHIPARPGSNAALVDDRLLVVLPRSIAMGLAYMSIG